MSMNLVTLLYLIASVCFIQALKGLSHPTTSRRGNLFGVIGMVINFAVAITVAKMTAPTPKEVRSLVAEIRIPKGAGEPHMH